MKELFFLYKFHFLQIKNKIKNFNKESFIKLFILLFFGMVFIPLVFQLFYFIIKHFYSVPIIGHILIKRVFSSIFLTFSIMIVLSSIVSAIPNLYTSRDMDFLLSHPLSLKRILIFKFVKIFIDASWMLFFMCIPIFLAYKFVLNLMFYKLFLIFISLIPFFLILTSIGILLTLLLVRFFPAEHVRNIAVILSGTFIVVFVIYFRMLQPERLTGADAIDLTNFINAIKPVSSPYFIHSYFIKLLNIITYEKISLFFYNYILFIFLSLIFFILTLFAGEKLFFEGYGKSVLNKGKKTNKVKYKKRKFFLNLLYKDLKFLIRDTSQWIQIVFLLGLVIIYLFNIYKLPVNLFNLKNIIYVLNGIFIGFILSAIGSRFVLPVISMEGKAFWIYKSSPVSIVKYVLYKFIIYSIPLLFVGLIVSFISIKILKVDLITFYLTMFSTIIITFVVSGVGIGIGGCFSDFNIKNPESLITGIAGVTYMFITLFFIGFLFFLEAGFLKDFYFSNILKIKKINLLKYFFNFALIIITAIIISGASLYFGIKKLIEKEI